MGGKPLSDAIKGDSKVLKDAFEELVAIERIKKLEIEAKTDPKKKLCLMKKMCSARNDLVLK